MTVLFKDEGACFLIDDETGMPATKQDLLSTLRDLYKAGELDIHAHIGEQLSDNDTFSFPSKADFIAIYPLVYLGDIQL